MRKKFLGHTSVEISEVILGCGTFGGLGAALPGLSLRVTDNLWPLDRLC